MSRLVRTGHCLMCGGCCERFAFGGPLSSQRLHLSLQEWPFLRYLGKAGDLDLGLAEGWSVDPDTDFFACGALGPVEREGGRRIRRCTLAGSAERPHWCENFPGWDWANERIWVPQCGFMWEPQLDAGRLLPDETCPRCESKRGAGIDPLSQTAECGDCGAQWDLFTRMVRPAR